MKILAFAMALFVAWLAMPQVGQAQFEELFERAAPSGLQANADELKAWKLFESGSPIKAREIAERINKQQPSSFLAAFVLGQVHQYTEGNFPRALFHYTQALERFERRFGSKPSLSAPWRWHAQIVRELAEVNGNLERFEEKLSWMQRFNELYEPDTLAERAWPLMKLGRYDEARTAARLGISTGERHQIDWALNALCAIEFEAGNDGASYDACKRALDVAKESGRSVNAIDLSNFAEASRSLFRLEEAERILLEATRASVAAYGNPWIELAELYIREGRFSESFSALKEVNLYRQRRPPHAQESDRNEGRRALSGFLIAIGKAEDASRITAKALVAPDRRGHNSRDPAQDRAIAALLDRRAHRMLAQQRLEEACVLPWYVRVGAWFHAGWLRMSGWMSGRQAVKLLSDESKLVGIFRVGTAQSAVIQPWLVGELSQMMGPGVVEAAIRKAKNKDKRPESAAYYEAFLADVAYVARDWDEVLVYTDTALKKLGPAEALLRSRMHALAADAAYRLGDSALFLGHFETALQVDPGVLRRLDLPLPVVVVRETGSRAADVADALEASPRFTMEEVGFKISIETAPNSGRICLLSTHQDVLGCGEIVAKPKDSTRDYTKRIVSAFHDAVFAPRVNLSQADVNSLDGSNRVSRNPIQSIFGAGKEPL